MHVYDVFGFGVVAKNAVSILLYDMEAVLSGNVLLTPPNTTITIVTCHENPIM